MDISIVIKKIMHNGKHYAVVYVNNERRFDITRSNDQQLNLAIRQAISGIKELRA
jgi:hypothetical protein